MHQHSLIMAQIFIDHLEKQLKQADQDNIKLRTKIHVAKKNETHDLIKTLRISSLNFWRRFFPNENPYVDVQLNVFDEEVKEFKVEVAEWHKTPDDYNVKQRMAQEFADVVVTALMVMEGANVPLDLIESSIIDVALKNDAKTHDTHAIDPITGKITRITKLIELGRYNAN